MEPYFRNGLVSIYHCDCREWLEAFSESRFSLLLTDPPYGLDKSSTHGRGKLKHRILNAQNIHGWDIRPDMELLTDLMMRCGDAVVWGGNYFPMPPCRGFIMWDKQQPWENFSQAEYAYTTFNIPAKIFRFGTRTFKKVHATQKPLPLIRYCLDLAMKQSGQVDGFSVFDPFAGSGTTGVACMEAGVKCVLCEMNEQFCELSAQRLSVAAYQPLLTGMPG